MNKKLKKRDKNVKFLIYVAGRCPKSYEIWLQSAITDREIEIKEFKNLDDLKSINEYPDLVLYTGGEDVSPFLYNEKKGKYTYSNSNRDEFEHNFWNLFNSGKRGLIPKLGICRGAQFITVKAGGKLIQHVEGHNSNHLIDTNDGRRFNITSDHHQMMYPFDVNYNKILAWSRYFKSPTYLNGENKEITLVKDFVEPEIVFYQNVNALCIQGHPEYSHCDVSTSNYCKELLNKLINNKLVNNK